MLRVWRDARAVRKQSLDLQNGKTVLLTFPSVPFIPIKSANAQIHDLGYYANVYTSGGSSRHNPKHRIFGPAATATY